MRTMNDIKTDESIGASKLEGYVSAIDVMHELEAFGMRDTLAGLAMQSYIAKLGSNAPYVTIAAYAYKMADAMIKESGK